MKIHHGDDRFITRIETNCFHGYTYGFHGSNISKTGIMWTKSKEELIKEVKRYENTSPKF